MSDKTTIDAEKLQKLGARLRRQLDTLRPGKGVRKAKFQEYIGQDIEQKKKASRAPLPTPTKGKNKGRGIEP